MRYFPAFVLENKGKWTIGAVPWRLFHVKQWQNWRGIGSYLDALDTNESSAPAYAGGVKSCPCESRGRPLCAPAKAGA